MRKPHASLQILHPFAQSKPSKALEDEDRFMREHGGAAARGIFLGVEAIYTVIGISLAAPLRLFVWLIDYDHPLAQPKHPTSKTVLIRSIKTVGARHRKTGLKGSDHAKPCCHSKSTSKRRA